MVIVLPYSEMPSFCPFQVHFICCRDVLFASPFVIPFPDPTLLFSLGISAKPRTDPLPERHPIEAGEPHVYLALVIGC